MENSTDHILIIAEIANAHEGDPQKAKQLILAASEAGADAVKMQKYTTNELLVKAHSRYEHFKEMEMPKDHWTMLIDYAKSLGIKFFVDVFGVESYAFMKDMKADGIKIHSSDLMNEQLLKMIEQWLRPLFLSCGGATELEIFRALAIIDPQRTKENVFLLHGFQNFPTSLSETHLKRIATLKNTFKKAVGYMDHIDAEDPMAFALPLLAVQEGATVIEKHITLDRSLKGIDYYSSLNPDELIKFVQLLRSAKIPYGNSQITFQEEELNYRKKMKKQLVAAADLKTGSLLKEEDVTYKRAESDCNPLFTNDVVGKKVISEIKSEEVIDLSKIEQKVGILIIARFKSQRIPGKALIPIEGKPALEYLIERARLCKEADEIILCTTTNPEDNQMEEFAISQNIKCYRGEEEDVLKRMLGACAQEELDIAIRVTGDDILLSPEHLDLAVKHLRETNADYCHTKDLPPGCECEVFTTASLETIYQFAKHPENTEYLTYFIEYESFYKRKLEISKEYKREVNLTLDTPEDSERVTFLLKNIYNPSKPYTQKELTCFIDDHKEEFKREVIKDQSRAKEAIDCSLDFSQ